MKQIRPDVRNKVQIFTSGISSSLQVSCIRRHLTNDVTWSCVYWHTQRRTLGVTL